MEWVSTTLGGGKINQFPAIFTDDSKYFFCPSGDSVKMFSVTTGEQTRILQGHTGKVIGTAVNPENPLQLYTFSRDGKIGLWDYNDAVLLSTIDVGFSPRQFALSPTDKNVVFLCEKVSLPGVDKTAVYVAKMKKRALKAYSGCNIYAFNIKTRTSQKIVSMKYCLEMQATPDGEYLVIRGRKSVKLVDLTTAHAAATATAATTTSTSTTATGEVKPIKYKHPHLVKCIAVHPKQHFVAFGNIRGEIMFLHCFGKSSSHPGKHVAIEKAVTSAQRWHQVAVQCLAFDAEGTHMYSGGRESVVVIWQLESGTRDFIPRLGATILGLTLSPDQMLIAVRMSDNRVKLANARSRLSEGEVEGINAPPSQRLLTGLQVDPRDRTFVFNATDGQIQFYNANEDRSVRKLQVASKNPLNYFRSTHIADHVVQSIAFSKRGEWLVSVDRSPANSANTTLKFWLYDERQRRYELNTQINDPHTSDITGLCYNPASDMCVTSSADGKFKVWVLVERQPEEDEDTENAERDAAAVDGEGNNSQKRATRRRQFAEADMCWACKSVGFYRDLPATAVSMSSDGSILAVAYSHIITLWNPVTNSLISTLTCAVPNEQITKLAFLNSAPFLVACSDYRLYVWDLLTCQVAWSHVVPAKLLTVDTVTSRFAIYAPHRGLVPERGTIILWDPTSPKPLLLTRTQGGFIKGLCFAPPSPVATAPANLASTSRATSSAASNTSASHNVKAGAVNKALAPLASTEPALVYMDKSNHMICLENISSEQKSALLRKHKKRQQQSINSNSSTSNTAAGLTAEIQAPAAMLKDSFHKQMNSKALREGPNVFMQLYGDPEVQLDVVAGGDDMDLDDAVNSDDDTAAAPTPAPQSRRGALPPQIGKKAAKPAAEVPHSVLQLDRFVSQLDAPSHSLPTTTAMFQQFADALVLRSTPTSPDQGQSTTPAVAVTAATTRSVHYHQTERARLDDVTQQHKEQELFSEAKLLERELASSRHGGNGSPYRFLHDFFSSGTMQSQVQVRVTEQDREREREHESSKQQANNKQQPKQQKVNNTTPNTKNKTPTPKTTNNGNSNVTPQHTATTTNVTTTPKNNKSPKAPSSSTKKRKRSTNGNTDE